MFKDLTGLRFERWTVVERLPNSATGQARWLVRCDCGNESVSLSQALTRGGSKSCGCLQRELSAKRWTKHGNTNCPEWQILRGAISRCHNPRAHAYQNYGGRCIVVCERWRESLENFIDDMGKRPDGMTLDRIDTNGPYSKENCRWAPMEVQQNNRRDNRVLEYMGRKQTMSQWSRELGLLVTTIAQRLERGWPVERALGENVRTKRTARKEAA